MNWEGGYFSKFEFLCKNFQLGDRNKNCRGMTDAVLYRLISIQESSVQLRAHR